MATTATTKKSTAAKKSTTVKKAAAKEVEVVEEIKEEVVSEEKVTSKTKSVKKYDEEDYILCKSVVPGETILIGKKSETRYTWDGIGDTCEVEVRDLNSLKASRSAYLYEPLIVIEDEDFVAQAKWKDISEMYEKILDKDFDEIINLPLPQFKSVISELPEGYRKSLTIKITDMIEEGTFDSMNKIKAIDEAFGTDLKIMIN